MIFRRVAPTRKFFSLKKLFLLSFITISSTIFAQGNCGNLGFEEGTTNGWICRSGTFGGTITSGNCADNVLAVSLTKTGCLSGGTDDTNEPPGGQEDRYRHTIMSRQGATDPNSLGNVTCVAPASMFPSGVNKYSFRIGNAVGTKNGGDLAFAESIKYTFKVTKENAGLTYLYSAFLNDPNHPRAEAPRFEIKITIVKNGKDELIDCGYYQVEAGGTGAEFHNGKSTGNATWKYTNWTKVGLDLSGYMNQDVTIEFTTADCYPSTPNLLDKTKCTWSSGEHSAYAYIDLYCTPVEIISPPVCANQASVELCAPPGYASYEWPKNQPGIQAPYDKQCVTIKNPKSGTVYTVNMKSVAGGCPTSTKITLKGSDFNVKDAAVCNGGSPVKLYAIPTTSGNYHFKWEPQVNLDCYDCPNPTFTPGTTTTYTVTMSDSVIANCNQVKEVKITVGASFTVETADTEICEGETATLTATGAETYTWKDPAGATYTGATINVTPATTTTYTVTGSSSTATCPGNPDATATVTVKEKPMVTVTDVTICQGQSAKLDGIISGGGSTGTWSGGSGKFTPNRAALDATYKPTSDEEISGTVILTLDSEDPDGPCVKSSKSMTITIVPPVTASAGPDQTICQGESVTLAGVFGGAATSGKWSGGTGTFTPDNDTPNATYKPSTNEEISGKATLKFTALNATNASCPGGEDEMIIFIDKMPSVSAGADHEICYGSSVNLVGTIGGSATGSIWSGGTGIFSDKNSLTSTYTPSSAEMDLGKVTLTLTTTGSGKCPSQESKTNITIYPQPVINFSVDTPKACPPHCVNFFDSTTVVGSNVTKWEWNFGNGSPNSPLKNPADICFPRSGSYDVTLTATSDKNCSATLKKPFYIETYKTPDALFIAQPQKVSIYDPTIQFFDQSTSDVVSWKWNLGDGKIISPKTKNPLHKYEIGVSAVYQVTLWVINDHGCVDSTLGYVEVLPEFTFYIPNAFTPAKNDGINDTFYGKGVGILEYHIWIFDRWGNMVFNTTDINTGWDGRANNGVDIAQQDVFVWKVRLKDVFGKYHDYIGTVTLVK